MLVGLHDGVADVTWVIDADAVELGPLWRSLGESGAAYLVFHGAHAALARIGATGSHLHATRYGCTQIAAMLLAEGTRPGRDLPSLDVCATKVLGLEFEAGLASPTSRDPALRELVGQRSAALVPLLRALTPRLRKRKLSTIFQLECDVLPAVVDMEHRGVHVDAAGFERIAESWATQRRDATDPDRISKLDKLLSTYAYWPREYIRRGRIFSRLHPLATDSGRFSCTDPNLQQVPAEHTAPGLRGCFGAPEGFSLIIADYAQIELRVAAHVAGCDALRSVFVQGRDPHRTTASTITGKPEDQISGHERQLAKAVNFGFLFGMGARRFGEYARGSYGVELSPSEAKAAKDAFLRTYPGIAAWHQRVGAMGRNDDAVTVRTELGRRKRFISGKFSFNAALNIPVQGTAAEGFKRAMTWLHERLPTLGGHGVLCIHDEYIAEVPTQHAEKARTLVADTMAEAMSTIVTSTPIEVDAKIASSWSEK